MSIKDLIKNAQTVDFSPELTECEKRIIDQKGKIAAAILNKRYDLQMNQTQFAEYMGVSQGMISRWENGEYNFTIETMNEILAKLGIKPNLNLADIIEENVTDIYTSEYADAEVAVSQNSVPEIVISDCPTGVYSTCDISSDNLLGNVISSVVKGLQSHSTGKNSSIRTNTFNSGGYAYATVR